MSWFWQAVCLYLMPRHYVENHWERDITPTIKFVTGRRTEYKQASGVSTYFENSKTKLMGRSNVNTSLVIPDCIADSLWLFLEKRTGMCTNTSPSSCRSVFRLLISGFLLALIFTGEVFQPPLPYLTIHSVERCSLLFHTSHTCSASTPELQ